MTASVLPLSLRIPVAPAPEDRPGWYAILLRVARGEHLDPDTVRLAASAAIEHHDMREGEIAKLNVELPGAVNLAMVICAELAEYRGCDW